MRISSFKSLTERARKLAAPVVGLAGVVVFSAPTSAEASNGGSCTRDSQCRDGNWRTVDWCDNGTCINKNRLEPECRQDSLRVCWWDGMCGDGDPNTVDWCSNFRCNSAPRAGGVCEPGPIPCHSAWDCRDGDPDSKNWCYQGTCVEADRDDPACLDEGSTCRRGNDCRDGDRTTRDWCYQGRCYHAPKDTGMCEGSTSCDPEDCPDDGNECTQADCNDSDECYQRNIMGACDNGNGTCEDGTCVPNPPGCDPAACPDDGNECTMAGCDSATDECNQTVLEGNDCNGGNGTCDAAGTCVPNFVCDPATCPDDGNECTEPACDNNECVQNNLDGNVCSDGAGTCQGGSCVLSPVCDPATCPADSNECTQAACIDNACGQENLTGTDCNGGNGTCQDGTCVDNCNPAACPSDGNECTQAVCDGNDQCAQQNLSGTECNGGAGVCDDGTCVQCTEASDCNDGNECTSATCSDSGECQFNPVADLTACSGGVCIAGACQAACDPATCPDDGNECTTNICNPDNSCGTQPTAAGSSCAAGGGTCDGAGECSVCMPSDCNDDNECTIESCDGANCGSNPAPDGQSCAGGNGVCAAGVCDVCEVSECNDSNECTADVCEGASCANNNVPNGTSCATGSGVCIDGACDVCDVSECDDSNECTADVCDGANCANNPLPDGESCAGGSGTCSAGQCNVCVDSQCDDGNECTMDACDGASCANTPVSTGTECNGGQGVCNPEGVCVACLDDAACSDGVACNGTEVCQDNVCVTGEAVDCTPTNECQVGECSEPNGDCNITNLADGVECAEGEGLCISGECTVCDPESCDDMNECTEGICDGSNACANVPVNDGVSCNSGGGQCLAGACVECVQDSDCGAVDACTQPGTCVDNACQPGAPVVCVDDGNPCTASTCDPATGCSTTNVADGTSCGSAGGTCQAGACQANPINCEPIQITLDHTRRGAVNNPASGDNRWKVVGDGYQIRTAFSTQLGAVLPLTSSYHCYNLASIPAGTIVNGYLEIAHSGNSYDSSDPTETVAYRELSNISCDAQLDASQFDGPEVNTWQEVFDDVSNGTIFGEITVDEDVDDSTSRVPLNAAALASLQAIAGTGTPWGLGGTLTTGGPPGVQRVFRGTDDTGGNPQPATKLVLTIKPDSCGSDITVLNTDDVGYFLKGVSTVEQGPIQVGDVIQSFHFENPRQAHQFYGIGNDYIDSIFLGTGNAERRAYFVFDVGNVSNAVAGKLRIWGWQSALANAFSGAYNSPDPFEDVGLFPVSTPAVDIINAPYNDTTNHVVDVPIFDDLGTGFDGDGNPLYGERRYTVADEQVDLFPAYRADPNTVCDPLAQNPTAPCGKWLEFDLSPAAIADINAANGQWTIGQAVTSIDVSTLDREFINNGTIVDVNHRANAYTSGFVTPDPQLILRTN